MHPGKDAITPPSVALHLMGSRQGNRGPPLPPPLIGCLCWLRHTGLAGPGGPAPRAGRWRRLLSCHLAAESQPLAWSQPPLRALGDCWLGGEMTSGDTQNFNRSAGWDRMWPIARRLSSWDVFGWFHVGQSINYFLTCHTCALLAGDFFPPLSFAGISLPLLSGRNRPTLTVFHWSTKIWPSSSHNDFLIHAQTFWTIYSTETFSHFHANVSTTSLTYLILLPK